MVLELLPVVPGHLDEEGSSETQATCSHSTAEAASGAQGAALEKQPCLHGYPSTGAAQQVLGLSYLYNFSLVSDEDRGLAGQLPGAAL